MESHVKGKPLAPIKAISERSNKTDDSNMGPNEIKVLQRESRRSG